MKKSPERIMWWGIALLILGALAQIGYTSAALQSSMISEPAGNSFYFWIFSPALVIIQNAAFPLGAALIGASVVIRYFGQSQPTRRPQPAREELS